MLPPFSGLKNKPSKKIELFIIIAVGTSNPTQNISIVQFAAQQLTSRTQNRQTEIRGQMQLSEPLHLPAEPETGATKSTLQNLILTLRNCSSNTV
jgi:hypothetical protein